MFDAILEGLPVILLVAATAVLYGMGARIARRNRPHGILPGWRIACFGAGLIVLLVALVGPVDTLADDRFSMHMTQHVLIMVLAAPLLAVGAPVTVLVLCLSRGARKKVAVPVLRSRVARLALSPAFALSLFTIVLWGSHYPGIYDAAARNQGLHDLEHLSYLLAAALLWSVVFGFDFGPKRPDHSGRLLMLFAMMAVTSILGLVLTSTPRALYPYYVHAADRIGISPLGDLHLGGVIMWICGMVTTVSAMVPVLLAWLAEDERRTVHAQLRAADRAPTTGR